MYSVREFIIRRGENLLMYSHYILWHMYLLTGTLVWIRLESAPHPQTISPDSLWWGRDTGDHCPCHKSLYGDRGMMMMMMMMIRPVEWRDNPKRQEDSWTTMTILLPRHEKNRLLLRKIFVELQLGETLVHIFADWRWTPQRGFC